MGADPVAHFLRPDLVLHDTTTLCTWVVDVVTSDAYGSYVTKEGQGPRSRAAVKIQKYAAALPSRPGWALCPFVWDTSSGFGPEAWAFLHELARLCLSARRRLALPTGEEAKWTATTQAFLAQRISIAGLRQQCGVIRERSWPAPHLAAGLASGPLDARLPLSGVVSLSDMSGVESDVAVPADTPLD